MEEALAAAVLLPTPARAKEYPQPQTSRDNLNVSKTLPSASRREQRRVRGLRTTRSPITLPFALLIPTNLPVHVCYLLAESHAVAVESVLPCRRHTQSDHETNAGRRRGEKDAARPRVNSRESTQGSCCYVGDEEDAARPRVNSEERTQGELL